MKKNGEYKKERKCDGNYKVERKWKDGEYKEERKCKGSDSAYRQRSAAPATIPAPAPTALVYPPWIVMQQGERVYHPQYRPQALGNATRCNSDTVAHRLRCSH